MAVIAYLCDNQIITSIMPIVKKRFVFPLAIATSGARGSPTRAIAYFCALPCGKAARQRAKEGILGRLRRPKPHLKRDVATAMLDFLGRLQS
jgi:hypothetical protein